MFSKLAYLYSRFFKKYLRGKSVWNSKIDKTAVVCSGSQVINSSIGRYSNCGYDCQILDCSIGNFCSLAANVVIGSNEHPMHWVSISPVFENVPNSGSKKRFAKHLIPDTKHTSIGNDVWIGHGAIIKAGVIIGTGAVIGSGAVVTKDVAPYTVVGGCPAKFIKDRFTDEIKIKLLESQWWDLPDTFIQELAHLITKPEDFIKELENKKMYRKSIKPNTVGGG